MVRFLVVRFSSIGDIILTTPVLRHLKNQVEDAEIHFLTKSTFASLLEANPYVDHIHPVARRLMNQFWPGGLTLVFKAGPGVSSLLTGDTRKIGIRLSSHPVATGLARAIGGPISGTSANISGKPACRNAGEVLRSFGKRVDLILDGGETKGKTASTVLDVTLDPPQILRQGMVQKRRLEEFITVNLTT